MTEHLNESLPQNQWEPIRKLREKLIYELIGREALREQGIEVEVNLEGENGE